MNSTAWGRLALLGAVLLAGCGIAGGELLAGCGIASGDRDGTIAGGHIAVVLDTARGVACYHDQQSNKLSCVKVKP